MDCIRAACGRFDRAVCCDKPAGSFKRFDILASVSVAYAGSRFVYSGSKFASFFFSLSIARTKGDKDYTISFAYGLLSLSSQICAWYIMTAFAFPSYGLEIQNGRKIWIAVVLIELLINLEICAICYKPVIRNGMHYESCRMIGTTQKNVQTERNAGS